MSSVDIPRCRLTLPVLVILTFAKAHLPSVETEWVGGFYSDTDSLRSVSTAVFLIHPAGMRLESPKYSYLLFCL